MTHNFQIELWVLFYLNKYNNLIFVAFINHMVYNILSANLEVLYDNGRYD